MYIEAYHCKLRVVAYLRNQSGRFPQLTIELSHIICLYFIKRKYLKYFTVAYFIFNDSFVQLTFYREHKKFFLYTLV